MLGLLFIGVPVAFAFLTVNIVGIYAVMGGSAGLLQLAQSLHTAVASFSLVPIPFFILMGEVMFRSGVGTHMIGALNKWMGRLPGRLGLVAVAGGALFSTLSGSSAASTAMLGSVLVEEMEARGYDRRMSIGPILGSGGLAIMIPPSALGVLLASLGRIPVGPLLIGIITPGILMALLYATYIVGRCWLQPQLAPAYEVQRVSWGERFHDLIRYILPIGFIILLVIGLILMGVATPTESAALGAFGAFVLAWAYGGLTWRTFIDSLVGTARTSVMILLIVAASTGFSQVLAATGATRQLVNLIGDLTLPPLGVLIMMQLILLIMGMFMEPLSILMVTLPVFMPVADLLGFDPVWFGAIILLNMEMATTTPPFGLSLFVMRGVAPKGTTMGQIYRSATPFLVCDAIAMVIMMLLPQTVLWLPGLMSK